MFEPKLTKKKNNLKKWPNLHLLLTQRKKYVIFVYLKFQSIDCALDIWLKDKNDVESIY